MYRFCARLFVIDIAGSGSGRDSDSRERGLYVFRRTRLGLKG